MDITEFSPPSELSDTHCLLEWIKTFPNSHSILTLSDVNQSSLVVDVLKELDGELYKSLSMKQLQNNQFAWQLSRYLLKHICKQVIVANSYSIQELVSKLLYVCVHSERKQAFIEKILKMDEDVQSILMRMIQKIEDQVVAVKESRMILDKISDLETGNEQLQQSLNKNKVSKEELNKILEETKAEVKRLDEQCQKFRKQRLQIMRQLQIDQFSSFIKAYRKIEQENQEFSATIKELQSKVSKLDEQNKNLKQKIIQDGLIISKYHQDSNQMRLSLQKLRSFKRKTFLFSDDSQIQEKSSAIHCYTEIVKELEDHIVTEKQKFTRQIGLYDEQLSCMKNENMNLKKTTRFLSSQIGQLHKIYNVMKEHVTV